MWKTRPRKKLKGGLKRANAMDQRYPKTPSQGANNTVIALSATEVAKLFTEDTRSDIGSEAEKMKYANQINALVVKFVRLDLDEAKKWEMLVMKRLYPLDFRTYEYEARVLQMDVFEWRIETVTWSRICTPRYTLLLQRSGRNLW